MKFIKFFQYAYLLFAILFLYDVVSKYLADGTVAYMSLLLGATALFMFFFRKKFNKKFENRDNSN
jgi:hypothetical protein